MLASMSLVSGIVFGVIVLAVTRRGPQGGVKPLQPTAAGWWTFGLGLAAAALTTGAGALMRHDRQWPTWAGLVAGLVPAIFWIVFAAGYIFGPGE